jgi:hypothetical protein
MASDEKSDIRYIFIDETTREYVPRAAIELMHK